MMRVVSWNLMEVRGRYQIRSAMCSIWLPKFNCTT